MQATRRNFLTAAAAVTALSQSKILGANDRIRIGGIGTGGRGTYLLSLVNKAGGAEIVALCDVYEPHVNAAKERVAPNAQTYADYRQLLQRNDIDAVVIGAPDHWHVPLLLAATDAGKDVYVEKPLTHSIGQGQTLLKQMEGRKQIVQTGMQQRSWPLFKEGKQLVDDGELGEIRMIETYWYQDYRPNGRPEQDVDTSKLDWKMWLGSAPDQPFNAERFHLWRWYWDFGGGAMTDLFTHWVDVAQWYMNNDTPLTALTGGNRYIRPEWDCPDTISAYLTYPGHFSITYNGTLNSGITDGGLVFHGSKGLLKIDRSGYELYTSGGMVGSNKPPAKTGKSDHDGTLEHIQNFFECVRAKNQGTNAPVTAGVAAARASHLGNLSLRDNRMVRLDEVAGMVAV